MSAEFGRTRAEGCLSDLSLDRLLAGELDASADVRVRAHLAVCGRCASRFEEIEASRAAFLADPPPLRPSTVRPRSTVHGLTWGLSRAMPLAAAAALAVWATVRQPAPETTFEDTASAIEAGTRLKGSPRIGFYVKRGTSIVPGAPGDTVRPGDTLQFTYSAERGGYLAILSIDGARRASVYYPAGSRAVRVGRGTDMPLDTSVVLDTVLGPETAYGLFCRAPIELEPVRVAFEAWPEKPPIPPSCEVDRLPFVKESVP